MNKAPKFVNQYFAFYFTRISRWVSGKFGFTKFDADDIATQALVYAISPLLRGESKSPETEKDWLYMAKAKARNLALDEIKRRARDLVAGSIDSLGQDRDGGMVEEHLWVEQASCDRWLADQAERDRHAKGKVAMKVLPKIFGQMKTSCRDQAIYRAVVLDNVPVKEVCKAFRVNQQQVYTIRFRVNEGLRKYGPAIVDAAHAA